MRPTLTSMSQQPRRGLRRRVLVGDGPARLAADDAERALQAEVVHLDHEAVDLVVEASRRWPPSSSIMLRRPRRCVVHARAVRVDAEAQLAQPLAASPSGRAGEPSPLRPSRAGRRRYRAAASAVIARVELAQRAGGGVARVGEQRLALAFGALLVEPLEAALGHVDLAAHLEALAARRRSA